MSMQLFPCSGSFTGSYGGAPTTDKASSQKPAAQAQPAQHIQDQPRAQMTMVQPYYDPTYADQELSYVLSAGNNIDPTLATTGHDIYTGDATIAENIAARASEVAYGGMTVKAEGAEVIVTKDIIPATPTTNMYAKNVSMAVQNPNTAAISA